MFGFAKNSRYTNDKNQFPLVQLLLLSLVRISEPIAITSTFPYAWQLILHYNVGDRSNASFYSGLFISAFAFSECLSGFFWGALSDRIGRKPCLLIGCTGTALSLLIVGLAPNFWVALLGRILGGLLNGNMGVCQTMVGELVKRPEHERKFLRLLLHSRPRTLLTLCSSRLLYSPLRLVRRHRRRSSDRRLLCEPGCQLSDRLRRTRRIWQISISAPESHLHRFLAQRRRRWHSISGRDTPRHAKGPTRLRHMGGR